MNQGKIHLGIAPCAHTRTTAERPSWEDDGPRVMAFPGVEDVGTTWACWATGEDESGFHSRRVWVPWNDDPRDGVAWRGRGAETRMPVSVAESRVRGAGCLRRWKKTTRAPFFSCNRWEMHYKAFEKKFPGCGANSGGKGVVNCTHWADTCWSNSTVVTQIRSRKLTW